MFEKLPTLSADLRPGEVALRLDTGHKVAVSMVTTLLANGSGVAIAAEARLIDKSGATVLSPCGTEIKSGASHSCDAISVETHGVPALTREVLMLVLGEEGAGLVLFSDEMRVNASIRTTITWAEGLAQAADLSAVLDL